MTTISATVVGHAVNLSGPVPKEIFSVRCRYPRWIHAEGRTHRQLRIQEDELGSWEPRTPSPMEDPSLSRNAASSRAIPVKKMIEAIVADPAIPMFWGANQRGMQAGAETNSVIYSDFFGALSREQAWLHAMQDAIDWAEAYDQAGYHKQIINRLLEPFMHIETLFTATEWSNFFKLRIHPAAEPHICLLATRIKEAMDASVPVTVEAGSWYLPMTSDLERRFMADKDLLTLSTARCAHLSYETVGTGEPIGLDVAQRIVDQLMGGDVVHASPFEHQAMADAWSYGGHPSYKVPTPTWLNSHEHGNLVGWRQHRKMIPGECG